jgi:hypothetical protein
MTEARAAAASPHGLALALALAVTLAVLAAGAALLHLGRLPYDRSGQVVVLFPPGADRIAVFAAVAAADGLMVRETWLSNVVLAEGAAPGFVGRLADAGAWAAYTPFDLGPAMVGGCSGIPPIR